MNRWIDITPVAGYGPSLRHHLGDVLSPIGSPASEPVALMRIYSSKGGIISAWETVKTVHFSSSGEIEAPALRGADRALKDRCGGAAFSVLGDNDLRESVRHAAEARPWFKDWFAYHLPQGLVMTAMNPIHSLDQLREGFGEEDSGTISDKIFNGVFAVLTDKALSNHERLEFAGEASAFIAALIRDDQIGNQSFLKSVPNSDRGPRYAAIDAALENLDIRVLPAAARTA